jgi:hypothetical protein
MIAIRKEFPDAKIIILTTHESDVQGAIELGAGVVAKDALGKGTPPNHSSRTSPEIEASHHDSGIPFSTLTRELLTHAALALSRAAIYEIASRQKRDAAPAIEADSDFGKSSAAR